MRRRLAVAVTAALLQPWTAPPARATGPYTFDGVATIECYGCGASSGTFSGTFTGVIEGHIYTRATVTMDFAFNETALLAPCSFSSLGAGTMSVSDLSRSDSLRVTLSRAYYSVVIMTIGDSGAGVATFVPVDPSPVACGTTVRADMRGSGAFI